MLLVTTCHRTVTGLRVSQRRRMLLNSRRNVWYRYGAPSNDPVRSHFLNEAGFGSARFQSSEAGLQVVYYQSNCSLQSKILERSFHRNHSRACLVAAYASFWARYQPVRGIAAAANGLI
jgi:hypothetical protein